MSEQVPARTYVFMLGWGAGIVWALLNVTGEGTAYWFTVGLVAIIWLCVWAVIFGIGALLVGFLGIGADAARRLRQ